MERPQLTEFDLVLPPARLYHAAPTSEHETILTHGLDPARFPRPRWDERDLGVWCFDSLSRAVDYAKSRGAPDWEPDYEVWEIDSSDLDPTRPGYDPDGPIPEANIDVWYLEQAVPADRVRLASSPAQSVELD
jgi:hypothetical protein